MAFIERKRESRPDIKFADFSWAADRTIKLKIYNFIDQCNLNKLNQRC